jgi:hypothetical protein
MLSGKKQFVVVFVGHVIFLVCNHSQENPKTKTWRPCWYHKQKKLMTNLLLSFSNMAAMTSQSNEELQWEKCYDLIGLAVCLSGSMNYLTFSHGFRFFRV